MKVVKDIIGPSRLRGCRRGTPHSRKKMHGKDEHMKTPFNWKVIIIRL